jgi:hypothetical protein
MCMLSPSFCNSLSKVCATSTTIQEVIIAINTQDILSLENQSITCLKGNYFFQSLNMMMYSVVCKPFTIHCSTSLIVMKIRKIYPKGGNRVKPQDC